MSGRPTRASWRPSATIDGGIGRIVVADVETGSARVVTPARLTAHDPLWSPDDRWIAFGLEEVDGEPVPRRHPNRWIRLAASWGTSWTSAAPIRGLRMACGSTSGTLVVGSIGPTWPTVPPSGSRRTTLWPFRRRRLRTEPSSRSWCIRNNDHWDLFVANSDGTNAHRLLEYAENDGWSADGRYVLAQWNPTDQPGGLALVKPDGSEFRVVVPFDALCDPRPGGPAMCTDGVGWGQARP